ncbi:MAG: tRNA uridine-5-carboxymethylaminomethyl(34) synthesis enzyme MnmG [Helicobacter bilis]|uniref:tRNA uridine-5-carboxymethylaminomethyl modification enzyme MnmG/GidA n=1 Tax=Helicobacter bilis TaxID=37372 RepID=UPI0026F15DAD|nr:FAD-dependent oxidoreductase [Helicobacter bilis]MCI7411800.1 tRNA uridine-5-carboxymethylaminomethyl(34) synthesis enzyme MnmG [Helicobacter bilis]
MRNNYDIIVVGGGHAGVEASHICAKMGLQTLLITHLIDNIALASCNPAIGGLGKGHLTKEVDSLGGLMGAITDISGLQYRILNASKGPAVRGTRAQIDMDLYRKHARDILLNTKNLHVIQGNVIEILSQTKKEKTEAIGVKLSIQKEFFAKKIIITAGTFLKGLIHIGENKSENGRAGEISSNELSESLKKLNIPLSRLKTGTCPRILGSSINHTTLEKHYGDAHYDELHNLSDLQTASLLTDEYQSINKHNTESSQKVTHDSTQTKQDSLFRNALEHTSLQEWSKFQHFVQKNLSFQANEDSNTILQQEFTQDSQESSNKTDSFEFKQLFITSHTEAPYFSLLTHDYLLYNRENIISKYLKRRMKHGYFRPKELPCFVTYTNEKTHKIIEENFYRAPLFTGQIQGVGPRYCPSIEDKINRFRDKLRHQLFLEPQTYSAGEYYVNGLSTSLPYEVQEQVIHSIEGLENAIITRYGYAIEYDYSQPTNLFHTLESRIVKSLYLAGQINGTTGYEEAAAQGILAGINAALSLLYTQGKSKRESLVLSREESYIGVMVDDLVTKGTNEPYRVFTSRAEYRLLLREDNACFRMLPYSRELGLLDEEILNQLEVDLENIEKHLPILSESYTPNKQNLERLTRIGEEGFQNKCHFGLILGRDSMKPTKMRKLDPRFSGLSARALKQLQIHAKYQNYIEKQSEQIKRSERNLHVEIPLDFSYEGISGLSLEVIEKLTLAKPKTLKEAKLISGITPASLEVLELHIALYHKRQKEK